MKWWDWSDPAFSLNVLSAMGGIFGALAAVVIPIAFFVTQRKTEAQSNRVLMEQREILGRSRRDALLRDLVSTTDARTLSLLGAEVESFRGADRQILRRALRLNPLTALPYRVESATEAQDYVDSLQSRYSRDPAGLRSENLVVFMRACVAVTGERHLNDFARVLTGDAALAQAPSHIFYEKVVTGGCWYLTSHLLREVADIPSQTHGGLKLNILTGCLLGVMNLRSEGSRPSVKPHNMEDFEDEVQRALASLLHYGGLSSFSGWSLEGRTEPVSATVAWLIRVVGMCAGHDGHIDMRCVQHLEDCIRSIPGEDKGWGIDDKSIALGFRDISRKDVRLWEEYGAGLVSASRVDIASEATE